MLSKLRSFVPLVVSLAALGVAVASTSIVTETAAGAVDMITGKNVKNSSLTGKDVKNGSLLAIDFKAGQLPSGPQGPKGDKGDRGDRAQVIGADFTGSIAGDAGAVAAHSCTSTDLVVTGAQVGEVPMLAFVGNIPAPAGLTFQVLKISAADHGLLRLCNPTNVASPAFAGVGVRILTFH
jgi:hypothetical protein